MSDTYRAVVQNANSKGIYVEVPSLGGALYGPLESIVDRRDGDPLFEAGDRVLIQQVGKIAEDFMVLGFIKRYGT